MAWRENGKQRTRTFATEKDARHFAADVERAIKTRGYDLRGNSQSLITWATRWITVYGVAWKASTMAQRADMLERHIAPRLGGYNLNEISRAVLQDFRRDMLRDGATAKTVNSVWRVLSACLGSAVEDGALQINPCAGIKSLRVDPPKRTVINEHDVARIFEALTGQPRDARLFALMVFAGLRPAEAIALRWDSVKDHTIVVGVSAQNGKITTTKTDRSRTVPITDDLRPYLSQRGEGYVCPRITAHGVIEPNALMVWANWATRVWRIKVNGELGIEAVPYDCRHTCVSRLIAQGHDPVQIAAWMGHSPRVMWDTYAHVFHDASFTIISRANSRK